MKVRQEAGNNAKSKAGIDEYVGRSGGRDNPTLVLARHGFERPRRRRPHGNDSPLLLQRRRNRFRRGTTDFVAFGFHAVIFDLLDAYRLKRAVADMKGDLRNHDAAAGASGNELRSEVESGGRCGDRSAGLREDGLVTIAIRWLVVALDIRRQGHVPDGVDGLDNLVDRTSVFGPQPDGSAAVKPALEDLTVKRARALEDDLSAGLQLLARMHESLPLAGLSVAYEQALHG